MQQSSQTEFEHQSVPESGTGPGPDVPSSAQAPSRLRPAEVTEGNPDYLAYISHELRNPVAAISGAAALLSRNCRDPLVSSQVATIDMAARYLLDLLTRLLNASVLESGHSAEARRPVSLERLFKDLGNMFRGRCEEKGLWLCVHVGASVPSLLWLDDLRLREVLFNLMDNALKFTNCGGIQLIASATPVDHEPDLMTVALTVRDSGIGIPPDQHAAVFEPFNKQRLCQRSRSRNSSGVGLGLSICKRIVTAMNGRLELQSEVDCGSSFRIVLDRVQVANPPGAQGETSCRG